MSNTNPPPHCPYCGSTDIQTDDFNLGPNDADCGACESRAHRWSASEPWVWCGGKEIREANAELANTTYRDGTPEGDL